MHFHVQTVRLMHQDHAESEERCDCAFILPCPKINAELKVRVNGASKRSESEREWTITISNGKHEYEIQFNYVKARHDCESEENER